MSRDACSFREDEVDRENEHAHRWQIRADSIGPSWYILYGCRVFTTDYAANTGNWPRGVSLAQDRPTLLGAQMPGSVVY